jgi:hypothetical protein
LGRKHRFAPTPHSPARDAEISKALVIFTKVTGTKPAGTAEPHWSGERRMADFIREPPTTALASVETASQPAAMR